MVIGISRRGDGWLKGFFLIVLFCMMTVERRRNKLSVSHDSDSGRLLFNMEISLQRLKKRWYQSDKGR